MIWAHVFSVVAVISVAAPATTVVHPKTIGLENNQAYAFSAPIAADTPPRLIVLDGYTLRIHDGEKSTEPLNIELPRAATAVDVHDVDDNGTFDVVAVAGDRVLLRNIAPTAIGSEWETIIERRSLYSNSAALPFPQVLVIDKEQSSAIALPQVDGFELWSIRGKLMETLPYGRPEETNIPAAPFNVDSLPNGSEGVGVRLVNFISSRHEPGSPISGKNGDMAVANETTGADLSDLPSDQWPYFRLQPNAGDVDVLYAPVPPQFDDTYIRLRLNGAKVDPGSRVGPPRRYPGRLLTAEISSADFNGDGFIDIVLWKPAVPGGSLSALIGTLRDAAWPVEVTVHLYNPETGLYDAEPFASIRARLPLPWYQSAAGRSPIHNVLFEDIDGDGFMDMGFSTGRQEYSVWTYRAGYDAPPAYIVEAPGPIDSLLRDVEVGPDNAKTLVLRGPGALYVARLTRN